MPQNVVGKLWMLAATNFIDPKPFFPKQVQGESARCVLHAMARPHAHHEHQLGVSRNGQAPRIMSISSVCSSCNGQAPRSS